MELLERDVPLGDLESWLADARAGRGRLALVGGEAGVGKTSLVREFAAGHHDGTRVLWSACDAMTTPRPLGFVADIAPALGLRPEALFEADVRRQLVFAELLAGLRARATILVIEDLHWADDATLDLIRYLARRISGAPVLLVASYRDEDVGSLRLFLGDLAGESAVRRLSLAPLSRAAVAALIGSSGIDPDDLYVTTGGNPFYVTEVVEAGGDEIPRTVRDAVAARAARLTEPARAVLDAAAIVVPPVETALLGNTAEHLDECFAAGMLRERTGGVEFRHELARRAIEQALPPGRKSELHARVLELLAGRGTADPARLAHHAEGAGDAAAVLAYAIPAAERAASLGSHRDAAGQYGRALRFAAGMPSEQLAGLLDRHAEECSLAGLIPEAMESRELALKHWRAVGDRLRQGDVLRNMSRLAWLQGDNAGSERAAQAALEMLEPLPESRELAMAYSNMAQLRMLSSDVPETIRWGEQAIDLAERLGHADIVAHMLTNMGTAEANAEMPTGRPKLLEALAMARALDIEEQTARTLTNLATTSIVAHDYSDADRWLDEGIAYCIDRDLNMWLTYLLAWQARSDLDQGRWDAAVERAEAVLRSPRATQPSRIAALVVEGRVRARRGDRRTWQSLDEALALAIQTGELQRLGPVSVARVEAAWLEGDVDRERAQIEQANDLAREVGIASGWLVGEISYWRWRSGGPRETSTDVPGPLALQMAGDWDAAALSWRELGCPYEAACALAETSDEVSLRAALHQLDELGARPAAAAVSRRLREMGVRGVSRGPRAASRENPANLTVREIEVLNLLANGLRNADIAGRLFISAKTVDHHVSAILSKLSVRSRGEAVRAAARLGVLDN